MPPAVLAQLAAPSRDPVSGAAPRRAAVDAEPSAAEFRAFVSGGEADSPQDAAVETAEVEADADGITAVVADSAHDEGPAMPGPTPMAAPASTVALAASNEEAGVSTGAVPASGPSDLPAGAPGFPTVADGPVGPTGQSKDAPAALQDVLAPKAADTRVEASRTQEAVTDPRRAADPKASTDGRVAVVPSLAGARPDAAVAEMPARTMATGLRAAADGPTPSRSGRGAAPTGSRAEAPVPQATVVPATSIDEAPAGIVPRDAAPRAESVGPAAPPAASPTPAETPGAAAVADLYKVAPAVPAGGGRCRVRGGAEHCRHAGVPGRGDGPDPHGPRPPAWRNRCRLRRLPDAVAAQIREMSASAPERPVPDRDHPGPRRAGPRHHIDPGRRRRPDGADHHRPARDAGPRAPPSRRLRARRLRRHRPRPRRSGGPGRRRPPDKGRAGRHPPPPRRRARGTDRTLADATDAPPPPAAAATARLDLRL